MSEHTPTPWYIDRQGTTTIRHDFKEGESVKRQIIVDCEDSHGGIKTVGEDDMKHIVKCVNAHDELVELIKECASRKCACHKPIWKGLIDDCVVCNAKVLLKKYNLNIKEEV